MEKVKRSVGGFVRDKLVDPTKRLTWMEVSVAVVIGFLSGVFPVPLAATLATIALASYLQFSAPQFALSTGVNCFCTPLQFLLIPLLARGFATVTGHDAADFTVSALRSSLSKGGLATIKSCGLMVAHALVMWCLCAAPIVAVCHSAQRRIRNDKNN